MHDFTAMYDAVPPGSVDLADHGTYSARFGSTDDENLTSVKVILALALAEALAIAATERFLVPADVATKRMSLANLIVAVPVAVLLSSTAIHATYHSAPYELTRAFIHTESGWFFFRCYCSHNIVQLGLDLADDHPFTAKIPMLLHHTLSIYAYTIGLRSSQLFFFGTSYGVCETTNVFLNILLLSKAEGPFGERVAKALGPLQTVNGLLLWVSFFVFRVLLFPWVLYTCYRDWTRMGASTMTNAEAFPQMRVGTEGYARITLWEQSQAVGCGLFLWVLSCWWFYKLTLGVIKTLRGDGEQVTANGFGETKLNQGGGEGGDGKKKA